MTDPTALAEIDADAWDRSGRSNSLYLTHAWLRSVEGRIAPESFYVLLPASGSPARGRLTCFLLSEPVPNYATFDPVGTPLMPDSHARVVAHGDAGDADTYGVAALEVTADLASLYPALVCAAPNGYLAGIDRTDSGDAGSDAAVVAGLLDRFDELASSMGARTAAVLYLPERDGVVATELRARGYEDVMAGANSVLEVPDGDFGDYVSGLRGIKASKEIGRFRELGITIEVHDGSVLDERLAEIQLEHHRKYGVNGTVDYVLRSFRQTQHHLGDLLRVILASKDGVAVGFSSCFKYGNSFFSRYGAVDRSVLGSGTFAHFNMQYYEMVRLAQAEGVREINYGLGSYPTKVRRGCRLDGLRTFVRPMDTGPAARALSTCWRVLGRATEREIGAHRGRIPT